VDGLKIKMEQEEKLKKAVQECVKESITVDKKNKKLIIDFGNFKGCLVKKVKR